jgi:hypothetical protein
MNNFLEASRCYSTIWSTLKTTKKIIPERMDFEFSVDVDNVVSNYVGFLVLHPYSQEIEGQLKGLKENEQLEKNRAVYQLITSFLSEEIISTDIFSYNLDQFELFRRSYKNYEVRLFLLLETSGRAKKNVNST